MAKPSTSLQAAAMKPSDPPILFCKYQPLLGEEAGPLEACLE
jgi:hypothetical protein